MTEADILSSTYEDTCTIYRTLKTILKTGETVFEEMALYHDMICSLSFASGGKIEQSKSTAITKTEYKLFVRPEVDIQANDTIIITRLSKKIVCIAGLSHDYISHKEIPLILKKEKT